MKRHWALFVAVLAMVAWFDVALCQERAADQSSPQTFAIETPVARTYNYLDNMVNKGGLPYFNIFWDWGIELEGAA